MPKLGIVQYTARYEAKNAAELKKVVEKYRRGDAYRDAAREDVIVTSCGEDWSWYRAAVRTLPEHIAFYTEAWGTGYRLVVRELRLERSDDGVRRPIWNLRELPDTFTDAVGRKYTRMKTGVGFKADKDDRRARSVKRYAVEWDVKQNNRQTGYITVVRAHRADEARRIVEDEWYRFYKGHMFHIEVHPVPDGEQVLSTRNWISV